MPTSTLPVRAGLAAAFLGLLGCASSNPATTNAAATADQPATAAAAPAPAADPKGVGLDPADLDRTVSPCADFFQFSGGNWLKNNPVPSYASTWGPRNLLGERTQKLLRQILEDATQFL